MSVPDLSYLKELCGLRLCSVAGFCRPNTTGRWSLPCGVFALSHGAILGETRAKSVVLSVPPCRDPRRVDNGVVTGSKTTSPKASSRGRHTLQLCHQSHLLFVPGSPNSPRWMQCLGVWMYWLGPDSCVFGLAFLDEHRAVPRSRCSTDLGLLWTQYFVDTWDSQSPFLALHASGWAWSHSAPLALLSGFLFPVDRGHQSHRLVSLELLFVC